MVEGRGTGNGGNGSSMDRTPERDSERESIPVSRGQRVRLRRILTAAFAAQFHLALCWASYSMDFMRLELPGMLLLTLATLGSSLLFLLAVWFNLNLRLRDPSMTLPQMLVAISVVFASAFFAAGVLRPMFLMMVLLVMVFGAFRLNFSGFLRASAYAIGCYVLLVLALLQAGVAVDLRVEAMNALEFCMMLAGVSLLGLDMSRLRRKLQDRNRDLRLAFERIQQLAVTDELTGLYNRRFANELLDRQKGLADRGDYQFVLCLVDIDHFKEVNDRYGHAVGDQVLRQLARVLQTQVRDVDFVARFGGEEFLLVLSRSDEMGALHMLERVRQSLAQLEWEAAQLQLTISAGVSRYQPEEDWEQTLLRADEALYRAKHGGRDRVVLL